MPKQLTEVYYEERVCCTRVFLNANFYCSKTFLKSIITMDESNVPFHIPEMKEASKQWFPEGARLSRNFKTQDSRHI